MSTVTRVSIHMERQPSHATNCNTVTVRAVRAGALLRSGGDLRATRR